MTSLRPLVEKSISQRAEIMKVLCEVPLLSRIFVWLLEAVWGREEGSEG